MIREEKKKESLWNSLSGGESVKHRAITNLLGGNPGPGRTGPVPCDTGEGWRARWGAQTGRPGKTRGGQLSAPELLRCQLVYRARGPPRALVEVS